MTYKEFLEWEPELTENLRARIAEAIIKMGEDVKGISWFSVVAPEYRAKKYGKNKIYTANFATTICSDSGKRKVAERMSTNKAMGADSTCQPNILKKAA